MAIKVVILSLSLLLMVAVILLAAAGIRWSLTLDKPFPIGGHVVLAVSGLAAATCLARLWMTRHDHLA